MSFKPPQDKLSDLLRMAMRLYNSGYHAGHHDTVEAGYVDIHECDMENYHEDEAREIVQDFLGSNLTDADREELRRENTILREALDKFLGQFDCYGATGTAEDILDSLANSRKKPNPNK